MISKLHFHIYIYKYIYIYIYSRYTSHLSKSISFIKGNNDSKIVLPSILPGFTKSTDSTRKYTPLNRSNGSYVDYRLYTN